MTVYRAICQNSHCIMTWAGKRDHPIVLATQMLGFVIDGNTILTNLPCNNSNYELMMLKKVTSASNGEIQTFKCNIPKKLT